MSTYSFFTYNSALALSWAREHELTNTKQAIAAAEPVAVVVNAMLRDAGVAHPESLDEDEFIAGEVWQVCQWLHNCPIPSFITGVVKDHGRNLINPEATILASQIEKLGNPSAAIDFALYVPELTHIMQRKLRRIIEGSRDPSLLFAFDKDVAINPW